MVYFFDCMEGMGLLPLATKIITFLSADKGATHNSSFPTQTCINSTHAWPWYTMTFSPETKSQFVALSVLHAVSETSFGLALHLWILHLLSPSELRSILLAAVTYKNFGIMQSSLRTFYFLVIIFSLQANQGKLDKDLPS